ncbi:SDR family oxidoreductase [Zoogloea sp. LCSB751]|uniref:SDR family oxidoreductase n=1 Tax=Zoogloea sp. LCSB751 TaxID=1965277 RepID=UPI0009A4A189|nr:SDR family oxidoreductase [Zoogloea sp. LCSB751]
MIKALLTGHSRGLGTAIADALLARGIPLLALARSGNPQLCSAHPDLLQEVSLDFSDTPSLQAWLHTPALRDFFADAESALLINNAGLLQPVGLVGEADATAIAHAVAVNVTAPLLLTNAFVATTRHCADRRVVHISSGAARSPYAGWSVYCATKAALDHQARAMAAEHLPGLRVASLAPGVVDTAMQAEIRASSVEQFPQKGRFEALKNSGQLTSPDKAAQRLVNYLLGPNFGDVVDGDLRHLPD